MFYYNNSKNKNNSYYYIIINFKRMHVILQSADYTINRLILEA